MSSETKESSHLCLRLGNGKQLHGIHLTHLRKYGSIPHDVAKVESLLHGKLALARFGRQSCCTLPLEYGSKVLCMILPRLAINHQVIQVCCRKSFTSQSIIRWNVAGAPCNPKERHSELIEPKGVTNTVVW